MALLRFARFLILVAIVSVLAAPAAFASPPGAVRSLRAWAKCDGVHDDTDGVTKAFAAAANGAFTLNVDCPAFINVGNDVAKTIFLDNGLTVAFSPGGLFIVDNSLIPTFVIANSHDVALKNWRVEYRGGIPVDANIGYYVMAGQRIASVAHDPPAGLFNDQRLAAWLTANRGLTFSRGLKPDWAGPTEITSIFYLVGQTSRVTISGMSVFAPRSARGDQLIPMVFAMAPGWDSNQTIVTGAPRDGAHYAVPSDLKFSNIDIDGAYMGWCGALQNAVIEHVRSHRYGDLQDASGGQIGGNSIVQGKPYRWFAPPHLFYLTFDPAMDRSLHNKNIRITDVVDDGTRIGVSLGTYERGHLLSLKISGDDSIVDGYRSNRPDGLLDVLDSRNLTIRNVEATYDSSFMRDIYPGIRFPGAGYHGVTLENITLNDVAQATKQAPIWPSSAPDQGDIVFKNVRLILNNWVGPGGPAGILRTAFPGAGDQINIAVTVRATHASMSLAQTGPISAALAVSRLASLQGPGNQITWSSGAQATACLASGAWSGEVGRQGNRSLPVSGSPYRLTCSGPGGAATVVAP